MNIFYMVCMEETMAETGRLKELIDILNKAASVYYQGKEMDIEARMSIIFLPLQKLKSFY